MRDHLPLSGGQAGEKQVHEEESISLKIGDICPVFVNDNNKTAVLACGNILDAAKEVIIEKKLPYNLYSVPFVKPINKEQLVRIVEMHQDGLITMEEHQRSCGMGSAVIEVINDMYAEGEIQNYPMIHRIAIPDEFADVVGTQKYLREYEELTL